MEENIEHPIWYYEALALDPMDKLTIYINYFVISRALELSCKREFFPIQSFANFCNNSVAIVDHGNDWEKNGFAQKISVKYYGLPAWYCTHKEQYTPYLLV